MTFVATPIHDFFFVELEGCEASSYSSQDDAG